MVQCVWPTLGLEICAKQQCAGTISCGAMGTFGLPNLTGRVGGSDFNVMASLMEEIMDSGAVAKFSTTIKMHTQIWGRETMCSKPILENQEEGTCLVKW